MKIMLVSTFMHKWAHIDALRKEAGRLYYHLRQENPTSEIVLVSVEDETNGFGNGDIIESSLEGLAQLVEQAKPDVVHLMEATPFLLYKLLEGRKYPPAKIVVTCIDNEPLAGLDPRMIEECIHLSDHNDCVFFCYSDHAMQVLQEAGIRNSFRTSPLVDMDFMKSVQPDHISRKADFVQRLTVGFASTPFNQTGFAARGIQLLQEIVVQTGNDIEFSIPWREPEVAPPERFISDERVHLTYGFVDMADFYRDIDIYLLPFADYGTNHACPHSFWEALAYEKPLLVTDRVGIAPLVEKHGIGIVSRPDAGEITDAIITLKNNYQAYCDRIRAVKGQLISELLDPAVIVRNYYETYDFLRADDSRIITLWGWRETLASNGKELVKGFIPLKNYYSAQSEAVVYREKRFEHFPMNVFNHMELQAVQTVLEGYTSKSAGQLELMDIAAGEGRISEVLYGFGNLTVIENSPPMLKIIKDNLAINSDNSLTLLEADFLNMDPKEYDSKFDIVTTFRFIRHFEYPYRHEIYARIRRLLKPGGLLLFDVPNKYTEILLRNRLGWDKFNIYDVFWTKESIREELLANGLALQNLIEVGQYCFRESLDLDFARPMAWVAIARKLGDQEY